MTTQATVKSGLVRQFLPYLLAAGLSAPAFAAGGKLVRRSILPNNISSALVPATGAKGLPQALSGVWWADFGDQTYVVSFAKARWDAASRTAALPVSQAGVVAYPSNDDPDWTLVDTVEADPRSRGLEYVFADDLRSAEVFATTVDRDGAKARRAIGASIQLQDDGSWLYRRASGQTYSLKRIIRADGQHEAAFADYLKAFNKTAEVLLPVVDLAPQASSEVELQPSDSDLYLRIPFQDGHNHVNYAVTLAAPFAASMQAVGRQATVTAQPGKPAKVWTGNAYNGAFIIIHAAGPSGGKATVKVDEIPRVSISNSANTVEVSLAPGELKQIDATVDIDSSNYYRLSTDAGLLMDASGNAAQRSADGTSGILGNYVGMSGYAITEAHILANNTAQPLTAHVGLTLDALRVVNSGQLVVNGPSVTRTLGSVTEVDSFDLVVPAGYKGNFNLTINEESFRRLFVDIFPKDRDILDLFRPNSGYLTLSKNPTVIWGQRNDTGRFVVYYRGWLNAPNPNLTYTIQLNTIQ